MRILLAPGPFRPPLPLSSLRCLSSRALRLAGRRGWEARAEVSFSFVGRSAMRRLNRKYRGLDRPTDVLSFPLREGRRVPPPPRGPVPLGDVVVCLPVASCQAKRKGVRLRDEAALLVVHGVLHLAGLDHATKTQWQRMDAVQQKALRGFFKTGKG